MGVHRRKTASVTANGDTTINVEGYTRAVVRAVLSGTSGSLSATVTPKLAPLSDSADADYIATGTPYSLSSTGPATDTGGEAIDLRGAGSLRFTVASLSGTGATVTYKIGLWQE